MCEFKIDKIISERHPKVRTCMVLDKGQCAWLLSHCHRERERERESVCVCVCERERGCEVRCSNAVRVGPAWLQQHGCKFVTDVNLR